jgi:UDP-glucose 4-epimerase
MCQSPPFSYKGGLRVFLSHLNRIPPAPLFTKEGIGTEQSGITSVLIDNRGTFWVVLGLLRRSPQVLSYGSFLFRPVGNESTLSRWKENWSQLRAHVGPPLRRVELLTVLRRPPICYINFVTRFLKEGQLLKKLLVIGGAGYIGSHFCLFANQAGFETTVMDNLCTGRRKAAANFPFVEMDLKDAAAVKAHLSANKYAAIFHFAANSLVGESMQKPALYYENNVTAALNMLEAMRHSGHDRVVFSSTCAIYGLPVEVPIAENHPKNPISPYGRSKLTIEWMLEDYNRAYGIKAACLRYFNAAGCESGAGLGEDHRPETHLIPNVVRAALGLDKQLTIFGNDYPTPDGACIRDYIHVTDLADAHLKALTKLEETSLIQLNLGTGQGFSNLEVINAVSKVAGRKIEAVFGPRRPGDPPELVADARAANRFLNWKPVRSDLESIAKEVLDWISKNPKGYAD